MIGWRCDQCETWTGDPDEPFLVVSFDVEPDSDDDDDDDEWTAHAHLCSYECLAAWAMDEALKVNATN